MTAYLRMLLVRWYRRPWGVGSLWSMAVIPGIVAGTNELWGVASSNRLGFRLETMLYSTTALGVGLVAFSLYTLLQEEMDKGRGRALVIAGVDGVRLAVVLVTFGCLISVVLVAIGTASTALVTAAVGTMAVDWRAVGLTIAVGTCAMVPVLLLGSLLLPVALSRTLTVLLAILVTWVTNAQGVEASVSGIDAARSLVVAAMLGIGALVGLSLVWRRFPAGGWR